MGDHTYRPPRVEFRTGTGGKILGSVTFIEAGPDLPDGGWVAKVGETRRLKDDFGDSVSFVLGELLEAGEVTG